MKRLLVLLFFTSFFQSSGQSLLDSLDLNELTKRQLKSFGKNSMNVGDPYWAIDFFEKYLELKEDDLKVTFMLADAYFSARDYEMAEANYSKVVEQDPEEYPLARFYLAKMKMTNGKYAEAAEDFETFKKEYKGQTNERIFKKFVDAYIEGCEIAPGLIDSSLKLLVTHLDTSINKAHVESSPIATSDSIFIYASLKADTTEIFMFDDKDRPNRKLYTAKLNKGIWEHANKYIPQVNTVGVEIANFAFTSDQQTLFFTVCSEPRPGLKRCDIYQTNFNDSLNEFGSAIKLPEEINDKKRGATMPSVGVESKPNRPERLVLYFVSDKDGGRGNKDIWYSVYSERRNTWRRPRNAGSDVNTVGDEITPYYDFNSASLYYSSNALPGLGGYDVYRVDGQLHKWTDPENVGYPINTGYDDIYYTIAPSRESGFLVSNRPGGVSLKNETCCDDIYEYKWSEFIKINVSGEVFAKQDSVFNKDSVNVLNDAVISLYIKKGSDAVLVKSFSVDSLGEYKMVLEHKKEYVIEVSRDGYDTRKYAVNTGMYVQSDSLRLSMEMTLLPQGPIVLSNVYYGFDDDRLNQASQLSLDTTLVPLLLNNNSIIVELSSHTDSKGKDKYNLKLSQRRAESVVSHLIYRGIEKERLQAKGYGETDPIAPNTHEDGTDNPEGRKKNRRTSFKIIGKFDRAIFYED
ncbi:MAG: OOP family OmpA-OmpF porin [Polaribacter sp.]|jgi:OOP family OmpA-OmpF porin